MVALEIANAKGDFSKAARIGITTFNALPPDKRGILGQSLGFVLLRLGYYDEVEANWDVPPPAPYLWRNDPRGLELVDSMNLTPRLFFQSTPLTDSACRVYILSGRARQLATMYRSVASSPAEFRSIVGSDGLATIGTTVAVALRQSGDTAGAEKLLAAAEAVLQPSPGHSKRPSMAMALDQAYLARVYAAQGRKEEAFRHLDAAIKTGWLPDVPLFPTDLLADPALALLKADPRFQQARQRIFDRVKQERAELGPFSLSGETPKS
jgi:hypothetical protein